MTMRDDFCVFILTHGRPNKVHTWETLQRCGYTGKVFFVVDDEDSTVDKYRENFGDKVLVFSKEEVAQTFDEADNFDDRRCIVYARNKCFDLAREVGCRYFIELDDDYVDFQVRFNSKNEYGLHRVSDLEGVFNALLDYFIETPAIASIALSQGGDHFGGRSGGNLKPCLRRKAMNSFICDVERPFKFCGRVNEDVNTYTMLGRQGLLFFTVVQAQLVQLQTQSNSGGMTEMYLDSGTWVKSFYTVVHAPSCAKVGAMGDPRTDASRMHHVINWETAVPKILPEHVKKQS